MTKSTHLWSLQLPLSRLEQDSSKHVWSQTFSLFLQPCYACFFIKYEAWCEYSLKIQGIQNSLVNNFIHHCMMLTVIVCILMDDTQSDVFCFQRCKGYVGSEDWAVKRVWICFFPKSTGDNFNWCFPVFCVSFLYCYSLWS